MALRPARGRAIRPIAVVAVVLALAAGCQGDSSAPRPDATSSGSPLAGPARAGLTAPAGSAAADPRQRLAVRSYQAYLRQQAAALPARLDRDLETLRQAVARLRVTPTMMATGITRLVDEAIAEKLPGAEDRYARTDLADLAGNVQGAEAGYTFVRSVLTGRDAGLTRVVDRRFAAVDRTLARYGAATGYRPYPALSPADKLLLQSQLSALAESLSALPGLLTR